MGCYILFSQFILVCFIICKKIKIKSFVGSSSIDKRFRGLPALGFWGWASYRFLPFTVVVFLSWLALLFLDRVILFIYDVRVRGVVSMLNETAHSFFVFGSL